MRRYTGVGLVFCLLAIMLWASRTDPLGSRREAVGCVTFSPDGRRLAVTKRQCRSAKTWVYPTSRTVSVVDLADLHKRYVVQQDSVRGTDSLEIILCQDDLEFVGDRHLLAVGDAFGPSVRLFDLRNGGEPTILNSRFPQGSAKSDFAISDDAAMLLGASEFSATFYDLKGGNALDTKLPSRRDPRRFPRVGFRDDQLWTIATNSGIFVADPSTAKLTELTHFSPYEAPRTVLDCLGDTTLVADKDAAVVYDRLGHVAARAPHVFVPLSVPSYANLFKTRYVGRLSPDGSEFVVCAGRLVSIFNARTGERLREFEAASHVSCVAYSPDGGKLALGTVGDASLLLVDSASGRLLAHIQPPGRKRLTWLGRPSPWRSGWPRSAA